MIVRHFLQGVIFGWAVTTLAIVYWPRCQRCERRALAMRRNDADEWRLFCRRHATEFDYRVRRRDAEWRNR